ncbi:MAG: nodulation protein NfeD [Candidatus Eisenbacteria bacterium]|nr:nodulation protein NfeD [Candidatus Latescibacterota bacterium]MBD3302051.1 nodulation protein NfeD [Candidatus Eisenbacteria bacterium]
MRGGCRTVTLGPFIARWLLFLPVLLAVLDPGDRAAAVASEGDHVLRARVEDAITPVSSRHVVEAIETAREEGAAVLLLQVDTPGGLDTSMREAVKAILNSPVPVVVWVGPSGARAASAGVFLTLAAHVAAMAPGTNIGAAHPVGIGGGAAPDTTMMGKVVNDAVAYVRSIAKSRDRNADWAERAVRESISTEAEEAVAIGICDLIAEDPDSLLAAIDGWEIRVGEETVRLKTAGLPIREHRMTWQERILAVLTDPNIAYLLFLAGILGIFFELSNPGALLPGIVGGISLILALFAFQSLSVNFAGVLLILLALVLFVLEVKVPSSGALSIGGVVSLALGSLMLFRTASGGPSVSLGVLIPALVLTTAFFLFAVTMALRAQRRRTVTGQEGLVGELARVVEDLDPEGKVFLHGEYWTARSAAPAQRGTHVRVLRMEGLELRVEPVGDGPAAGEG